MDNNLKIYVIKETTAHWRIMEKCKVCQSDKGSCENQLLLIHIILPFVHNRCVIKASMDALKTTKQHTSLPNTSHI